MTDRFRIYKFLQGKSDSMFIRLGECMGRYDSVVGARSAEQNLPTLEYLNHRDDNLVYRVVDMQKIDKDW